MAFETTATNATVRAKMKCLSAAIPTGGDTEMVKLFAVCDDENKTWAKYTPGGSLELSINNPAAQGRFKVGEHYFVDISPAPAREADEP